MSWRRPGTTLCGVDSWPVSGSVPVTLLSKQYRTAKIRRAYPIHRPCADGYNGDC